MKKNRHRIPKFKLIKIEKEKEWNTKLYEMYLFVGFT